MQAGPTAEVLIRPASETAARLLDIPNVFSGAIETSDGGRRRLRRGPHALAIGRGEPMAGDCRFAILPHNVLLIRPDKPWSMQLENPVDARVVELLVLGSEALLWCEPAGLPGTRLQMRLPGRVLDRYRIDVGQAVQISVRAADVVFLA